MTSIVQLSLPNYFSNKSKMSGDWCIFRFLMRGVVVCFKFLRRRMDLQMANFICVWSLITAYKTICSVIWSTISFYHKIHTINWLRAAFLILFGKIRLDNRVPWWGLVTVINSNLQLPLLHARQHARTRAKTSYHRRPYNISWFLWHIHRYCLWISVSHKKARLEKCWIRT